MAELEACPYCGGKVLFQYDGNLEISGIRCPMCRCITKFYGLPTPKKSDTYGETMEQWKEKWNRRAGHVPFP